VASTPRTTSSPHALTVSSGPVPELLVPQPLPVPPLRQLRPERLPLANATVSPTLLRLKFVTAAMCARLANTTATAVATSQRRPAAAQAHFPQRLERALAMDRASPEAATYATTTRSALLEIMRVEERATLLLCIAAATGL